MKSEYYGLIEMSYVFGLALAFAGWELYSLKRDKKKKPPEDASTSEGKASDISGKGDA